MGISSKPITFAILAVAVIMAGALVTTVMPLCMPSTQPTSDSVKPCTIFELGGRDISIREGCNNCHTQSVRPLRTKMDALVVYLQEIGRDVKQVRAAEAQMIAQATPAKMKNPYEGNKKAIKDGKKIFAQNCSPCHGAKAKGDIGPNLRTKNKKYGDTDADLYTTISRGRPGGMPDWEQTLGSDGIWKVISFLRTLE